MSKPWAYEDRLQDSEDFVATSTSAYELDHFDKTMSIHRLSRIGMQRAREGWQLIGMGRTNEGDHYLIWQQEAAAQPAGAA